MRKGSSVHTDLLILFLFLLRSSSTFRPPVPFPRPPNAISSASSRLLTLMLTRTLTMTLPPRPPAPKLRQQYRRQILPDPETVSTREDCPAKNMGRVLPRLEHRLCLRSKWRTSRERRRETSIVRHVESPDNTFSPPLPPADLAGPCCRRAWRCGRHVDTHRC
jgi:hypothetical protein